MREASTGRLRAPRVCLLIAFLGACSSGPLALGRIDDATLPGTDGGTGFDAAPDVTLDGDVCRAPEPSRHYAFDGTGTEATDLRGGPSAILHGGATLDGTGVVHLDGLDDYVDLPNGILSGKSELTVAVWVRRLGGPSAYKRIFDFGTTRDGEDPPVGTSTAGETYVAAATGTGNVPSGLAALMSAGGPPGEIVALSDVVLDKEMRFVVVTVGTDTLSLFYEGSVVSRIPRSVALASIVDHNAWLGRSQYSADGFLEGDYADVKIFDQALTDCAIRSLYAQGADAH